MFATLHGDGWDDVDALVREQCRKIAKSTVEYVMVCQLGRMRLAPQLIQVQVDGAIGYVEGTDPKHQGLAAIAQLRELQAFVRGFVQGSDH